VLSERCYCLAVSKSVRGLQFITAIEMSVIEGVLFLFCCCIIASSEDRDDDSTDSESSSGSKTQDAGTVEPPPRLLSDQELNQLGAKVLRAEMMGDEVRFVSVLYFNVFL